MKRLIPIATLLFLVGCQTNGTKPQNDDVSVKHAATYVQCLENDIASMTSAKNFSRDLIADTAAQMNIIAKSEIDMEVVDEGLQETLKQGFKLNRKSLEKAADSFNNSTFAKKYDFILSGVDGCEKEWRTTYLQLSTDQTVEIPPDFIERFETVKNQDEYIAVMVDFIEHRMKQDGVYDEKGEKAVAALAELLPVFWAEFSQPMMNFGMSVGSIIQTSNNPKIKRMRKELESMLK